MSTFNETAKWLFVGIAFAPMVIGIGWGIYEGSILPRLIPRAEIDALADELCDAIPAIQKTPLTMKHTVLGTDPIPSNKASGIECERKFGEG